MSATGIDFGAGLRSYLVARGHELRGHEIKITCPFHEDADPSCRVDLGGGVWRCDPCGKGGGALALVEALESCDRPTAMRILSGDGAVSAPPPARPAKPQTPPPDLRGNLADFRASLRAPGARPALDWLAKSWNVSRAVLEGYGAGLGPTVRVQTDRGPVETFSIAVPSFRGGALSGLKLYRPRWRELAGDRPGKCISQTGSRPALVGGHLLGDAADRTVLVVGGEKDTLVAAAALPELVAVAHAGVKARGPLPRTRGPRIAPEPWRRRSSPRGPRESSSPSTRTRPSVDSRRPSALSRERARPSFTSSPGPTNSLRNTPRVARLNSSSTPASGPSPSARSSKPRCPWKRALRRPPRLPPKRAPLWTPKRPRRPKRSPSS